MSLHEFTYYSLLKRNSVAFKDKPAWIETENNIQLTFFEIKEKTDSLACGLQQTGIKKGDRIGVIGKNSLEFFLLYCAAASIGAVVLPVNWRLSAEEMLYNLTDGNVKALFADEEFQNLIKPLKGKLTCPDNLYNLVGNEGSFKNYGMLYVDNHNFEPPVIKGSDDFIIIHTAAVSGNPRGAMLTHDNIVTASLAFIDILNLTKDDVHLNILPLFHVGGLFMCISSFHAGALNINCKTFDADTSCMLIEKHRISLSFDFTPILSSILESADKNGKDISTLKKVIGLEGHEAIAQYQKKTGGTFYVMYGQTETSCLATCGKYNDQPGSAGKTVPAADIIIVDEMDEPVKQGNTGEIVIRGPLVFKEYINLSEDTAHTFRNGWHHTGDMGMFDENGFLFYKGRMPEKELIKPGGENVYPAEVENIILTHPSVKKTVVFGVPDTKWKEGIKAVCLLEENSNLTDKDLIDYVGSRIARYKKPQYVEFIRDFPVLENGMADREKIIQLYGEHT